ncbi:PREDICTED: plastid division protein CDP1, chloroplastic isoform X2 [Tarenaya hassleriana]|uniref:plastid division protein CDP1, chloroplastic isoform X2 n=1 Tax=Tarenaya hassleriana TaxID=28532 RepID=UPI00053CA8AB|nr:PREDICTED: plastid division protein CDP1, chloroplastic isoform X2 [Tarenaya hassleriana]
MPVSCTIPVPPSSCLLCGISNRSGGSSSFNLERPDFQILSFIVSRSDSGEFDGPEFSGRFRREGWRWRRLNAAGANHIVENAPSRSSPAPASPTIATIEIPVTCYQILGVSDQAEKDEVVKSVINLKKMDVEEGYTMEAAVARQDLLMDVRDKLLFEPEYAGDAKAKIPPKSPLRIPWAWLPGALCLLQEVGEEKIVLDIGQAALRHLDSKPYIHDILLSMALAECAIAKVAFEADKVSRGFEALARAQCLLKSKVTLGKLALLSQIEESLEELAPPCTLELLGLPRSPENAQRRLGAIAALRELLRQGLDVEASCQIQDWPCFLIQALSRLLATEIVDLLPWNSLAITRKNKKSLESHNQRVVVDFNCFYLALIAHIAVGFSSKQTELINKAKSICECLIASEGIDLKFEEALCSFLLKQGTEAEALVKLKHLEANSDSATRDSILGKNLRNTSAATPSLETWLKESVLAVFSDTRDCSPSLTNFFRTEMKFPGDKRWGSTPVINHKKPLVTAKNADENTGNMPSIQLKRNLGLQHNKIWENWLSQSNLIKKASIVALLACTLFLTLKLSAFRVSRLWNMRLWVSTKPLSGSDSFQWKSECQNLKTNLASVNGNGVVGNMRTLLDMFKIRHGEHSDGLYSQNSHLQATLTNSRKHLQRRPMLTEEAEDLVRQWENVKAEALGPNHQIDSLSEVLDESMLVQWQTLAQTAKARSCYWRFVLLQLKILQAHVLPNGIAGEMAKIEALLEEAAELVDESQPKNPKYYSTYKINYTLKKQEDGSWRFCESEIQIQIQIQK